MPAEQARQIPLGSQARIHPDTNDFAIPAKVSFVSPMRSLPRRGETRSERDKLVFRVRLRIRKA